MSRHRVTLASRFALLLSNVLRDVVMLVVPALLVVVISTPFGYHPDWPGVAVLLVSLCLVTTTTSAIACALGITLQEIGSLAAIVTGFTLPLTLLSGVLLPLSLAPGWIRLLAHLHPLSYAVEASRSLSDGRLGTWEVAQAFLVMTALTLVVFWWATRAYRKAIA